MTSLTSNFDRKVRFTPDTDPSLQPEEVDAAMKELYVDVPLIFTRSDRSYVDPALSSQEVALFSFVPSKGALPDKNGIYGFAKIRGTFQNVVESEQRATWIVQNIDSVHQIYHVKVGAPFPITLSSEFTEKINEIDIRDEAINAISNFVRDAGDKDMKAMKEIKEREELLKKDCASETVPKHEPLDAYIYSRKKIADNLFVFTEYRKKMVLLKDVIKKAWEESIDIETNNPEVCNAYKEKYDAVSKECGIDQALDTMALMVKQYFNERPDIESIFNNNKV